MSILRRSDRPSRDLLRRYRRLREAGRRVNDRLVCQLNRSAFQAAARDLKLWRRGVVVLGNEWEMMAVQEHAIHGHRPGRNGPTLAERFASPTFDREAAEFDEDEAAYRKLMARSRFGLFRVVEVIPHLGSYVADLLRDEDDELLLADEGMSKTATPGAVFAARLTDAGDFFMTTGLALPIAQESVPLIEEVLTRATERSRLTELNRAQWSDLARRITIACLSGLSDAGVTVEAR